MQPRHKKNVASQHLKTEQDYLTIIEKIINVMGQESNRIKVLSAILPFTLALSEVESGAFLVIDNEIKNMVVVTKQTLPDEIVEQLTTGNLGHILLKGQRLLIEQDRPKAHPYQNFLAQYKLKYLLGLPLQFNGHILGAIVVGPRKSSSGLPPEKLQGRLATLAQIVAMYLDNVRMRTSNHHVEPEKARLTQKPVPRQDSVDDLEELLTAVMSAEEEVVKQNYDLGMLNALSNHVGSSLQLSAVLEVAVKETRYALNADAGWCYLFQNGVLTLCEHQGLSEKYIEQLRFLKPGNGVEGMAFSRNEPVFRDGLLFHSGKARTIVKEEGLRTIAAMPLVNRDTTFGVLAVGTHFPATWSPRDERMLSLISRQVAQAVANSQQFTDAQEKAQSLETGYGALQQANKELVSRNALLEQQVEELRQAERQIWVALAASNQARRQLSDTQAEKQLHVTLKKILSKLSKNEQQPIMSGSSNRSTA